MKSRKEPTPLQAAFWLTKEELRYLLVICGLLLLGMVARFFYLKNQTPDSCNPKKVEQIRTPHE